MENFKMACSTSIEDISKIIYFFTKAIGFLCPCYSQLCSWFFIVDKPNKFLDFLQSTPLNSTRDIFTHIILENVCRCLFFLFNSQEHVYHFVWLSLQTYSKQKDFFRSKNPLKATRFSP